ncbi:Pkinase domain-containing protein [Cephalotus follicularis]|uniref:Pkinase domain-containing protein n=1 Tax=Cephalotus follicularis TaxID=3775 RepID=A0A1Q3CLR6_CEPFO|nr:Pkinase domain-containing protein [Cephalotus follicularis]
MDWVRGETIGCGSFATVSLATTPGSNTKSSCLQLPSLMAVKSCNSQCCDTLKNEKNILDQIGLCPQIIQCFGEDYTIEKGETLYNLLLEYASRGTVADLIKKANGGLPETDVKSYTRSMLKGLRHIHSKGFAHCDIKLENILVCDNGDAKIADFGLAAKSGVKGEHNYNVEGESRIEYRGTPLYMSPESVNENEYSSSGDVWALGCAVSEMVSGQKVWSHRRGWNVAALLIKIGVSDELPGIPEELSEEGKDFLYKCFVKDPRNRWTAEMLLDHPFVSGVVDDDDDDVDVDTVTFKNWGDEELYSNSPRGPFDLVETVPDYYSWSDEEEEMEVGSRFDDPMDRGCSPLDRIRKLDSDQRIDWSVSGSWVTVR